MKEMARVDGGAKRQDQRARRETVTAPAGAVSIRAIPLPISLL